MGCNSKVSNLKIVPGTERNSVRFGFIAEMKDFQWSTSNYYLFGSEIRYVLRGKSISAAGVF